MRRRQPTLERAKEISDAKLAQQQVNDAIGDIEHTCPLCGTTRLKGDLRPMSDEYNPGCGCYYCEQEREVRAEEEADGTRAKLGLSPLDEDGLT
jgi:hypothetical protein